jgi:aminopeptidase N
LKAYLKGRTGATKKELPLALTAGNPYIHYNKGALTLYALQDYISEEKVNMALHRFIKDWNAFGGSLQRDRYSTTADLLGYFRAVTPDTLQNVITDLFEMITIYDNKVVATRHEKLSENKYKVNLTIQVLKHRIDSLGVETSVPLRDWIDIGIYAKKEHGKDELIYLNKHIITEQKTKLEIVVDRLPSKAVIDPRCITIDKNRGDDGVRVE